MPDLNATASELAEALRRLLVAVKRGHGTEADRDALVEAVEAAEELVGEAVG